MRVNFVKGLPRPLRLVIFLILSCLASVSAHSQSSDKATTADKTPPGSIAMTGTTTDVNGCIRVEAVLLPRDPASKLFSGFVARNYAVVKTTISNECDKQQFILHDIYFDYSDWALSGVYDQRGSSADCPTKQATGTTPAKTNDCCEKSGSACKNTKFTQGTKPGQVATVGALDIQDQVTEDSVFSKRNLIVNGLTLIGQVAGGYAFVGSIAATQGIAAFNSAFVPNLAKFWPDRRLDQEQFLLKLGYRTDQSTAIAKDDHGSYYAFFPLATFLTANLQKIFLDDPAVFLNPAEAWLEPGVVTPSASGNPKPRRDKEHLELLRDFMWQLVLAIPGNSTLGPNNESIPSHSKAQVLMELASSCDDDNPCDKRILMEKALFRKASLNSVKIVVRGVMTVNLDAVPPTVDAVSVDCDKAGVSCWTVPTTTTPPPPTAAVAQGSSTPKDKTKVSPAAPGGSADPPAAASPTAASKTLTGKVTGKFLEDATLEIVAIDLPSEADEKLADYVEEDSVKVDSAQSSDLSMAFSMTIKKTLPSGTKLTFQATRTAATSSDSGSSSSPVPVNVLSNKYVYTVTYNSPPGAPSISDVTIDKDKTINVWQTPGKVSGTVTGSNLAGGTVTVSTLTVANKPAKVGDYIGTIASVPATSDASKLEFQLALSTAIPVGSTLRFVVSTKLGDKSTPSNTKDYIVTEPNATAAKATPKKPANKPRNKS